LHVSTFAQRQGPLRRVSGLSSSLIGDQQALGAWHSEAALRPCPLPETQAWFGEISWFNVV